MQLPLFSLHARLMCSTVLSEFTLRMFAIDFFFVVNNRLPFNKQWVTAAHNRSCVENMEVVGGGMGLFFFLTGRGTETWLVRDGGCETEYSPGGKGRWMEEESSLFLAGQMQNWS